MQPQLCATGTFSTTDGSKYLQQLSKHFAHKVSVTYDTHSAHADMPMGPCDMTADTTGLTITVRAADPDGLARAKSVVDVHLERFAFREDFKAMDWVEA